jgi:hypothetical protein
MFNTPPLLEVPPNSTFSAYLINTNGLRSTIARPLTEGTDPVKLNKLKLLKDRVVKWKSDGLNLVEMHDQNPTAPRPLQGWHKTTSTPVGGKHGTATLSAMLQSKFYKDTNVAAMALTSHSKSHKPHPGSHNPSGNQALCGS